MTDYSRIHSSSKPSMDWTKVYQYLQQGEYAEAAAWLEKAQLAGAQAEEPVIAALLTTVRQICLACQQCRVKIAWHEQAIQVIEQREEQLRLRAQAMIDHLREQTASDSRKARTTVENEHLDPQNWTVSFWAYLWLFLYRMMPQLPLPSDTTPSDSTPAATLPLDTTSTESSPIEIAVPATEAAPPALASPSTSAAAADIEEESTSTPLEVHVTVAETPSTPVERQPDAESMPPTERDAAPLPTPPLRALRTGTLSTLRQADTGAAQESFDFIIYCFGSYRVYQKGLLIEEWNGLKGLSLFKYLVMQRGTPVPKDRLMDLFWPDADPEAARRNLHQAIYSLRRTLRQRDPDLQHIQFEHNQYLLNPALSVWVDVEEFSLHVQRGHRFEAAQQLSEAMTEFGIAEGLYQGDFLAEDLYEEWTVRGRDHYRTTYLQIADRLSQYYLEQGEYTAAIAICQKMLTNDRCYEEAHRRLMHCYLAQGQRHLAIRQYHTCVQALAEELDVPPDEETTALYTSVTSPS